MGNKIIIGDVIDSLKEMDEKTVNCCITSPPYWSLRDYGKDGQIGNEETPEIYINRLVEVFNEVKRVLRDDGTLWVNLGDVYNGPSHKFGYKPKELMGLPFKLAFALQKDGWYLRSDVIWHKPNPMPESVKDRPTKAHEYMFLLTKKPKYYYDHEAIMEKAITKTMPKNSSSSGKYGDIETESKHRQGLNAKRGEKVIEYRPFLPEQKAFVDFLRSKTNINQVVENSDIKKSKVEHWFRYDETGFSYPSKEDWDKVKWLVDDWSEQFNVIDKGLTHIEYKTDEVRNAKEGYKNKRSVWTIPTKPFKGAHFATFPEALVEPCILAGSPKDGVVMDIFMGSGTTGAKAMELDRNFVGIELNERYVHDVAMPRLKKYSENIEIVINS